MRDDYFDRKARVFLDRLATDAEREWVRNVVEVLRKRYNDADHWTTGGEDKKYIDIRVGRKTIGLASGWPVFYIQAAKPVSSGTVSLSVNQRVFSDVADEPLTFLTAKSLEQISSWFDDLKLNDEGLKRLQGTGRVPANYPPARNGGEEESPDISQGEADVPKVEQPGWNALSLNRILYGPPGTGKTYRTIREALSIVEGTAVPEGDFEAQKNRFDALRREGRIAFVTFHQSFSYEDFIEGIRADTRDGQLVYHVRDGVFKKMAILAMHDPAESDGSAEARYEQVKRQVLARESLAPNDLPYVLIIDEINRGNMARIFGELITLIEPGKRAGQPEAIEVQLPYSNDRFSVPANLHIIGTMNTADRSLALMDTALRRRFDFIEMMPDPQSLKVKQVEGVDLVRMLNTINLRIEHLYDREHMIGHSFFMGLSSDSTIKDIARVFETKVLPLLEEYFYEDWGKIARILGDSGVYEHKAAPGLGFKPSATTFRRNLDRLYLTATYQAIYEPVTLLSAGAAGVVDDNA